MSDLAAQVIVNTGGENYDFLANRELTIAESYSVTRCYGLLLASQDSPEAKAAFVEFYGNCATAVKKTVEQMIRLRRLNQIVRIID